MLLQVGDAMSSLGDVKSSLGDAESSLGDAKSSLGDAKSSLGVAKSSLGDTKSRLGDAKSSLGDAESSLGDAKSSLGDAESSLGDADSSLGDAKSFVFDADSFVYDAKSSLGTASHQTKCMMKAMGDQILKIDPEDPEMGQLRKDWDADNEKVRRGDREWLLNERPRPHSRVSSRGCWEAFCATGRGSASAGCRKATKACVEPKSAG
jgi:hypothetical protein